MACISSTVLSILAANSMPAGKAIPSPAPTATGKQSALSAGTEQAASESSAHSGDPGETNFQQAFSSALHDSTAPARESGKPVSSAPQKWVSEAQLYKSDVQPSKTTETETDFGNPVDAQVAVTANRISTAVTSLIADNFSSTPIPASLGDSKAAVLTAQTPKEQPATKSKASPQNEPADSNGSRLHADNQAAALIGSVAPAPVVPITQLPAPATDVKAIAPDTPTQIPATQVAATPVTAAPAAAVPVPATQVIAAPKSSAQAGQSASDSLSFALLLHPKLAQAPITSQSTLVLKQAPDSKTAVPSPGGNSMAAVSQDGGSTRIQPVSATLQARGAAGSDSNSSAQQNVTSGATAKSQSHSAQNSSLPDTPASGKSEPVSDTGTTAPAGLSDLTKSVIVTNTAAVANQAGVPVRAADPPQMPGTVQVLNTQNQAQSPAAAKEVVVRLEGQSGEAISVRLVDQGGQVQVAVRSTDPATANLLRQDLPSLTNNLDRAGWKPEVLASVATASFVKESSQGSGQEGQNPQGQGHAALDWSQQDSSRKKTVADLWDEILTRQGT